MVDIAAEHGLDLAPHRSTPLDESPTPDFVFAMESHHLEAASSQFPELAVLQIRLLRPAGVDDPYGLGVDEYRHSAHLIADAIDAIDVDSLLDSSDG